MLRSEEMESVAIYIGGNDIKGTVEELGLLEKIEIKAIRNKSNNLMLHAIEKIEQQLNYLKPEIFDNSGKIMDYDDTVAEIEQIYKEMVRLKHKKKELRAVRSYAEEAYQIYKTTYQFIEYTSSKVSDIFLVGIIERDKKFLIKKILKTLMKNNIYIKMEDVDSAFDDIKKTILVVYVYGDSAQFKVRNIIATMGGRFADTYDKMASTEESTLPLFDKYTIENILKLKKHIRQVNEEYHEVKNSILALVESVKLKYKAWILTVKKERKIYEAINLLIPNVETTFENVHEINNVFYTGEAWIKKSDLITIYERCKSYKNRFFCEKIRIRPEETIPTAFETNVFMEGFQNITNVFGVPKYREINPAVFMVFTFPCMFGAMFGDVFHGFILLFISSYMIKNYERLNHNCGVFQILLNGRWIILCCSVSALWFGLLYGDFAGLPITLFKSQFYSGKTYPFGIDPIWHHAENSMTFTNSLKMKMSLIIGFIHMSLGSAISIINTIYFKEWINFYCIVLPQVIAFTAFLGYLVFLCFYKWIVTINYPSLVETLIGMYTDPLAIEDQMYPGQIYVQIGIFGLILICIPWMFFSKPIYYIYNKKIKSDDVLDIWINSGIHTIEFGLGLISNTSSYLRLWAVSLAHVQLTTVLHQFTIGSGGLLYKILILPVYIVATLFLLIGLEGLSSCLHALRLNWIEFFGKFYNGEGVEFKPLTFKMSYEEIQDE